MKCKLALVLGFCVFGSNAKAIECYDWPIRQNSAGKPNYDGDTIYIDMPGLPAPINAMSVRVAGLDTPEIKGQCEAEKRQAVAARDKVQSLIVGSYLSGKPVRFCDPQWGRYGGRVVAYVAIGDEWLHELLIGEGLARPYDGGKRAGWCE